MKFKIDENLPVDAAALLRGEGYAAVTVNDEGSTAPTILNLLKSHETLSSLS